MLGSIAPPLPPPVVQVNPHTHGNSCKSFQFGMPAISILKNKFNLNLFSSNSNFPFVADSDNPAHNEWEFLENEIEENGDEDTPWEGAIVYKRNASVSHLEYCTTLERLGLGKVSSEVSRNRASDMGLRVLKSAKDCSGDGTPVLISMDVSRRKQRLRLDGIVRTVIALNCNRCGEPAAQNVFSDFSLLLHEVPIEEPETINMGVIFGDDKSKAFGRGTTRDEDDGDEDALIDLDDQLYFPVEEKTIDISKNVRDLIHVEITISAICDPNCKGICLKCGANLNIGGCTCTEKNSNDLAERGRAPLGDLRNRMAST